MGGTPQRARCGFRIGKRRDGSRPQGGRNSTGADDRNEHRLLEAVDALDRADDCFGDLVGARDDGRNEQHDHRVDAGIGEQRGERLLVRRADSRPEHVHRVADARLTGKLPQKPLYRGGGKRGQAQPCGLAGVGAQDPEAACVRQHGDVASTRQRLSREQACDVQQFLEGVDAHHSGLVEERVDGRF